MREKIRFVQAFAEIGEYFDQPVKSYSSGMRARLNFGLSWAFDFDYYLMDEVGAVGDARFKQKSRRLMEERIGAANIILVSHAMPEIARLCNVVVLVDEGRATLYEDVDEGIRAYQELANIPPHKRMRGSLRVNGRPAGETGDGQVGRVKRTTRAGNAQTGQESEN